MDDIFIFVIDTDSYAGNFERELCAWMTGQIGDCEVGDKQMEQFQKDLEADNSILDFDGFVIRQPDEYGHMRPAAIWPTPGWFNDGIGGYYQPGQEAEALIAYKKEAKEAYKNNPEALKTLEATKDVGRWPAYLSVAIFFSEKPTHQMLACMKRRALAHPLREKFKITGFRLLRRLVRYETAMTMTCQP